MGSLAQDNSPPAKPAAVMTRRQKMEMYARLSAAGQKIDGMEKEFIEAVLAHDFETATVVFNVGKNLNKGLTVTVIESIFVTAGYYDINKQILVPLPFFLASNSDQKGLDYLLSVGYKLDELYEGYVGDKQNFNIIETVKYSVSMLQYLLQYGAKPATDNAEFILRKKLPPEHFKLLLEYGLDVKAATDVFSKHVVENKLPAAYLSEIAEILKLPPAVKSVLPKPPEPKMPVEIAAQQAVIDPDIIVIERPFLQNRTICYEFNFKTRERTSAVRKDAFSPVESIETKKFSDLTDHPDLRAAFDEHTNRGGQMTEQDVFSRPAQTFKFTM